MSRSFLRMSLLTLPLFLGACGEGWEAQKTTSYKPYGNYRTAGSGVVYVRAKLLPKKDLNLESELKKPSRNLEPVPAESVEEVTTSLKADEIFNEAQSKSGAKKVQDEHSSVSSGNSFKSAAAKQDSSDTLANQILSAPLKNKAEAADKAVSEVVAVEQDISQVPVGSPEDAGYLNDVTEKASVSNVNQSLEFDSGLMESELAPEAGDVLEEVVTIEVEDRSFSDRVHRQAVKQIIAPKQDSVSILSVGQETLHEIYNNPF